MSELSASPAPETFRTELEVRGYELDSFGHVNHANYLHYLETARWKMLADIDVSLETFRSLDRWTVIAALEIQYRKPILFGERIEILSRLVEFRRSSMRIEQTIGKGGIVFAEAKVRSVVVDGKGRPAEFPEDLQMRFRALTGSPDGNTGSSTR